MVHPSLLSSKSTEYETPEDLFEELDEEFGFTLDPCSTHENAKCELHYTVQEDGLAQDWGDHVVFMNPPYGRAVRKWMQKAYESAHDGALVVCLVPARTGSGWWHDFAMKANDIRLLRGRLRFVGSKHSAPFDSAVVVFHRRGCRLTAMDAKAKKNKAL